MAFSVRTVNCIDENSQIGYIQSTLNFSTDHRDFEGPTLFRSYSLLPDAFHTRTEDHRPAWTDPTLSATHRDVPEVNRPCCVLEGPLFGGKLHGHFITPYTVY